MRRLVEDRPNVVHSGAISGPMLMLDNSYGIAQANLGGAMGMFEACRQAGVRRLVWLSSIAVYGDQPTLEPTLETAAVNPQSFNGHTKAAGELPLRAYVARTACRRWRFAFLQCSTCGGEPSMGCGR